MPVNQFDNFNLQPAMTHAIRAVEVRDGVRIDPVTKAKNLRKFGRRTDVGTSKVTLADLAGEDDETYLTSNGITSVVSTDAGDTGIMIVEYHTISGTNFTFGVQAITLTGQTPATLLVPCARVSRMYNYSSTDYVGTISAYEGGATSGGVVTDPTEVHCQIPAGYNNTFKAATTISKDDYYLISEFHANLEGTNTARVEIDFEVATGGRVFLEKFEAGLGTAGNTAYFIAFDPYIIIPPNSDVRVHALSSSSSTTVSAYFGGYLATVLD